MKRILSLARASTVLTFLAMSVSSFAQGPCGGDGQRSCCTLHGEFGTDSGNFWFCNTGMSYAPNTGFTGCNDENGCTCSDGSNKSPGMCYQAHPCGGAGQRACCYGLLEYGKKSDGSSNGLACNDGLVQVGYSCSEAEPWNCVCGNGGDAYASGICVQPAPCGGLGQRACCTGLTETAISGQLATCKDGLTTVPGCSGDCTCGGGVDNPFNIPSTQSCTTIQAIAEPTTNATPTPDETGTTAGTWTLPQAPPPVGLECPSTGLCGYADLHVHMFANLAHGGAFVAGKPWDPNGVNAALGEDYGSSLNLVDQNGNSKADVSGSCPSFLHSDSNGNNLCSGQVLFHGDHTAIDSSTGGGTNDGANSNLGVPLFNGWPLWTSTVHQQVYYKWLERAWLGGLRLMVMLAVSNEALCKSGTKVSGEDCSLSMNDIDNQLQAALDFQSWLDTQYGGPGKGWFQIVKTPQQAQSVIQQGKLAVVLGIEVDNIFNCHLTDPSKTNSSGTPLPLNGEGPTCDANYVAQQLRKYNGMGVRHIFPIHDFDNAFGPTATWQDAINAGQRAGEGIAGSCVGLPINQCGWQQADNCPDPGYGFSFDAVTDGGIAFIAFGVQDQPPYPTFNSGSCSNVPGLTTLGANLIQQAMNMGFIIDVDHMSIKGFGLTLDMATQKSPVYAGIAASHVQFFDLYHQNYGTTKAGRHERMRTYSQLQRIANAGGMIGVMLKDDAQDTGNGWCLPRGNCPFGALNLPDPLHPGILLPGPDFTYHYDGNHHPFNNYGALLQNYCHYSTTETAQQYLYGVQAMNGAGGVGLGSDFMGIAGHVGPRFGNGACGGHLDQRSWQERADSQPQYNQFSGRLKYPFTLPGFGTFDKQVSGQKTYDFNVDGLAHIGLLPDMVADMMNVGVTQQQLQPLFGSAQAYITMWSKVYQPTDEISSGTGAASPFSSTGLAQGQEVDSPNGRFRANMQTDGNFVIYDNGSAIWATGTQGIDRLAVQPDGNLVIYGSSANDVSLPGFGVCKANSACIATWATGTGGGSAPYTLKMQDDGNLVLYDSTSSAVWASGTTR